MERSYLCMTKLPFEKTIYLFCWGAIKHRRLKRYSAPTLQRVLAKPLSDTNEKESQCVHSQLTTKEPPLEHLHSTPRKEIIEPNFDPLEVHDQSPSRPPRSSTISSISSFEKIEIYIVFHKNTQSQNSLSLSYMISHIMYIQRD